MLRAQGWAQRIAARNPWTNVYGLARSIVALATALTLLTTPWQVMWSPFFEGGVGPLGCDGLRGSIGLFCIVPPEHLGIAHRVAILILIAVAIGWRPRITGVLHWWVTFSLLASATRDGGDQVAALFALFLIPWTLTDPREWHWQRPTDLPESRFRASFLAHSARTLLRVQIMVVYLHSVVTKFSVEEWIDGTAVYYWVHEPFVGAPPGLQSLVFPATRSPFVKALTFGAIVVEIVLVIALVVPRRFWRPLFWLGVLFHVGIGVGLGLASFSLTMIGALIVYLHPVDAEYRWLRGLAGRRAPKLPDAPKAPAMAAAAPVPPSEPPPPPPPVVPPPFAVPPPPRPED